MLNGQEDTARVWWAVLRKKQASEEAAVTMKTLRRLLAGKIKGKELTRLAEEAETGDKEQPEEAGRRLQALGEVALAAGDEKLAKDYFTRAAVVAAAPAALVRWGDFLAEKKRWRAAADAYAAAWQTDRRQPLALFCAAGH